MEQIGPYQIEKSFEKKKPLCDKDGQQGAEGGKVFANGISNKSLAPKTIF